AYDRSILPKMSSRRAKISCIVSGLRSMNSTGLGEHEQVAIAQWPWPAVPEGRSFPLTDRDHLFCTRARQLTPTGDTAAAADLREVVPHSLFSFCHCLPTTAGGRLPYSCLRLSCIISSL